MEAPSAADTAAHLHMIPDPTFEAEEHPMSAPAYTTYDVPAAVLSLAPVVLPAPDRTVDLQVCIPAPVTGSGLPILLLSLGHGPSRYVSSLYGYAPLANFWAARGFVVIQPAHLDAMLLGPCGAGDPQAPLYWRSRAQDLSMVLDGRAHREHAAR